MVTTAIARTAFQVLQLTLLPFVKDATELVSPRLLSTHPLFLFTHFNGLSAYRLYQLNTLLRWSLLDSL